jgi:hypothetical protein
MKNTIKTKDAIAHFMGTANLARDLNIRSQAVSKWGEYVPELRAFQLREKYPMIFSA